MPSARALCLACLIALAAGPASADDERASLAAELGWVKFRVTAGRIFAVNSNYRESKTYETGNPLVGEAEVFSLDVASGSTAVHYELKTPQQHLLVDFDSRGGLTIKQRPAGAGPIAPVTFLQRRGEELKLILGPPDEQRVHRGRTLWHLMLLSPDATRQHLLPILMSLRPGWQIEETADRLEEALVQVARRGKLPEREKWSQLVEQLGSSRFSERRAAERQLREAGPSIVAFLQSMPLASLDAERRVRVERLLDSLSTSADDTPHRIALWLVDDPVIWLAVLRSGQLEHRRLAHRHLEMLLEEEIAFESEADADVRRRQVDALQTRMLTQ